MEGFAIIKLEADSVAAKEDIVQQFNSYMQQHSHVQSFVHSAEGYFRLGYNDEFGISSAGIVEFGNFLQSTGYTVTGIQSTIGGEAENSTSVSFAKEGQVASVVLSTVRIY